jgi:hypothetical protein
MSRRALVLVVALLGAPALLLSSDSVRADRQANLFEVATGFSAKEACSCAFVVGQTDEFCQAFGQIAGLSLSVDIAVDRGAQTLTATISGINRTARYTEGAGCTLDPLP